MKTNSRYSFRLALVFFGVIAIAVSMRFIPSQTDIAHDAALSLELATLTPLPEGPKATCLTVRSSPSGASVLINGRLVGATPLTLADIPLGTYGLRLEKEGCSPDAFHYTLADSAVLVERKLRAVASGTLVVEVLPVGSEILLDGEIIGHTPLRLSQVAVGSHELQVRKTNRESYCKQIQVEVDESLTFSGFELKDKVLTMLQNLVHTEPQRVAHYIDLGHYLFLESKLNEAADVFAQGMEVSRTPLNFDGPGYIGKLQMSVTEMQLEQRLRKEDEARFPKEVEKHRNWQRVDTRAFRKNLDEAEELLSRKNITAWVWVDRVGRMHIKNRMFDRAAKIYEDHIEAVKDSPELFYAYSALAEVYLYQQNIPKAKTLFDPFFEKWKGNGNGNALRTFAKAVFPYQDRIVGQANKEIVLNMAEKSLRIASELIAESAAKTATQFELATVLMLLNRSVDAIPYFELTVTAAENLTIREDRQLCLADAFRKADHIEQASALFKKLSLSDRASVRDAAKAGLTYCALKASETPAPAPVPMKDDAK